jgi:DNA polymerase
MAKFFGQVKISQIHGNMKKIAGKYVVAMYHPAAALHQPALKNTLLDDFAKLKNYMFQVNTENKIKENNYQKYNPFVAEKDEEDKPTQLSLF